MSYSIDVCEISAEKLLEGLIKMQGRAIVRLVGSAAAPVSARFISADETVIALALNAPIRETDDSLEGRYVDVTAAADRPICFTSYIVNDSSATELRQIALRRPDCVQLRQRRRFMRASIAPSAQVSVQWGGITGTHDKRMTLLNLSTHGMACRTDDGELALLPAGSPVHLNFKLDPDHEPCGINATLKSRTAAHEHGVILGFEFDFTDEAARAVQNDLRAYLFPESSLFPENTQQVTPEASQ